jgi:hypothetical protein
MTYIVERVDNLIQKKETSSERLDIGFADPFCFLTKQS